MVELIIQEAGQERLRRTLAEGQYQLGRTQDNDLVVASNHLSRQHLQITVANGTVAVMDLGSTNGTIFRGRKLTPRTTTVWPPDEALTIGPFTIHQQQTETKPEPPPPPEEIPTPLTELVANITCREALPTKYTLQQGFALIGSGVRCDIRPMVGEVEPEHCRLSLQGNRVQVINLSQKNPAKIAGVPLPLNQPQLWDQAQALEVSYARLYYTLGQAQKPDAAAASTGSGMSRWLVALVGMGTILTLCITVIVFMAMWANNDETPGNTIIGDNGLATPTLAPFISPTASRPIIATLPINELPTQETIDETANNDECAVATATEEGSGWLELPFPYTGIEPQFGGNGDDFRLISQRSRVGGRINSFFDHQYPIYPPAFGGIEADDVATTMLIFDGSLSFDAFSQDQTTAGSDAQFDYYSGHAGIDFAPAAVGDPRTPQTPVFAAADGFLHTATIDDDGNHMVWLSHDRGAEGNYATLYFHLADDEFFRNMMAMEEGAEISAGTRIGTMGTTGRSTGIHLHFEVRQDLNSDGLFTIYEKIDPYGYFPSEKYPLDPWSQPWVDRTGKERDGIISQYLWIHPLVAVEEEADACLPQTEVKVDLYPIVDWSVIHPGFNYVARNSEDVPIVEGPPRGRQVTVRPETLVCNDPEDAVFQFIAYGNNNPVGIAVPTIRTEDSDGKLIYEAEVRGTGQYILVAPNNRDCTPPFTEVRVQGNKVGDNVYQGLVTISLRGLERGSLRSTIKEIQYSLDCGQTWQVYEGSFTLTNESPHTCGTDGVGQGIQLGPDDFLLLAIAEDSMNNIEQPIKQFRFTILGDEP